MLKQNCLFSFCESESILSVELCGEIDHHSAVSVRTRIDEEIKKLMPKKTVLILSGIDFMDSSGLGLVMGRYALMERLGGELTVKDPAPRVMDIFELAGLSRMIKIETSHKDRREADCSQKDTQGAFRANKNKRKGYRSGKK